MAIGKALALPEYFYNQSNEKNLIKFDNHDDNMCFWRFLTVFNEIMEGSGDKIRYDHINDIFMSYKYKWCLRDIDTDQDSI